MTISISVIETRDQTKAIRAVRSTLVNTPATSVYWVSNRPCDEDLGVPTTWIRVANPKPEDFNVWYSEITLRILPAVVNTDHNIIVQNDGFAVNISAWTNEFLKYDYIGAPWLWWGPPEEQVGNGGFSLRSRKLYDALVDWRPGWTANEWPNLDPKYYNPNNRNGLNEDNLIAGPFRLYLETHYGIQYAPVDLAHQWSIEGRESWTNPWFRKSLGFHGAEAAHEYGIKL